jgi:hypothetical protein
MSFSVQMLDVTEDFDPAWVERSACPDVEGRFVRTGC